MRKWFLALMLVSLLVVSGCGWRIPFFGDKKVEQDEPVVQETSGNAVEQPQYSGVNNYGSTGAAQPWDQAAAQQYGAQTAPYNAYNYGMPATTTPPAYQQPTYGASGYPGQPAQAYQQPAAMPAYGANSYGAYGSPAYAPPAGQYQAPAYGSTYDASQYQAGAYGGAAMAAAPQSPAFVPTQAMATPFDFQGIKRKAVFLVQYPHRGLSAVPMDTFSQQIYNKIAAAAGVQLLPKEAVSSYAGSNQLFADPMDIKTKLAKLGREMGAHVVAFEQVQYMAPPQAGGEGNYQLDLEIIDVSSGYALKTYAIQGNSFTSTPDIDQVVSDLARNISLIDWYSRVVKVDQGRIFLNAGRLSGLQMGQKLRVYAEGSDVMDPATKMSLGKAQGAMKGIVKVADFFGMDGAICETVSGKGFAVADMVKAVE